MTVKELREELEAVDETLQVYSFDNEGWGSVSGIHIINNYETRRPVGVQIDL